MKVAVVGLGIIGQAWSRNLIADGLTVSTWNRTPKDFPGFNPDLQASIQGAEIIIIVVADPPAVAGILSRITPHLDSSQIVIQSSTISAEWSLTFASQVTATGAKFLEAPFTGSKPAAEARQTVFYTGGDEAVLAEVTPTLKRLSKAIMHIGPLGSASSLKLAMNMNIAMVMQALSESLTFARQSGISDDIFFKALGLNVSHSGVATLKEPILRKGEYAPQFSLKHMNKDLNLALGSAQKSPLPQLNALKAVYDRGMTSGFGEEDFSVLIRLLEKIPG